MSIIVNMKRADKPLKLDGDCDACDAVDTTVYRSHNMILCQSCFDKETRAYEATRIIETSRTIDASVQIKPDIFNAPTVSAVELRAAIENDVTIPDAEKDYAMAKECMARMQHMQAVIFEERKTLIEHEKQAQVWQVNAQTFAGKLRSEWREQFKGLDVNYQPAPITKKQKTTKPVKVAKPSGRKFDKTALYEAARKYDVPASNLGMILAGNPQMTPEDAAKYLATLLGKIKE